MNSYREYYGEYDNNKVPLFLRFNSEIRFKAKILYDLYCHENFKLQKCNLCESKGYIENVYDDCIMCKSKSHIRGAAARPGARRRRRGRYICVNSKKELDDIYEDICLKEYLKSYNLY